ncbi:MAG: outer membrane beta-barrel protein [Deltaproteobacteria bacterium]|nr:outer membrane beta-barrel protein [Deltaproteobacteria bacterium]
MKKTKRALLFLLPLLLLSVSTGPGFADILPKSYLALKGGYFSPTGDFQGDKLDGGPYWELAGGFNWGIFGAELGVGYLKTENSRADIQTVPILLSGKLQLPLLFMAPYARGGVGAYYTELDLKSGEGKGTKWSGGYHGGLGIDFRLGPVLVGIEGTYLATKPNFEVGEVTLDGVTLTGMVGFRF